MADIRLAIADPHLLVCDSLRALFNCEPEFEIVWTAVNVAAARQLCATVRPDVFLVNVELEQGSPVDLVRRAASGERSTAVVLLASEVSEATLRCALQLKVRGIVLQEDASAAVTAGIKRVAAGEHYFSPAVEQRLQFNPLTGEFELPPSEPGPRLTARQTEIVAHLAQGASAKEVARRLHLSEKSISSHTYRIMKRLNIHDRVELARFAIREGLVTP